MVGVVQMAELDRFLQDLLVAHCSCLAPFHTGHTEVVSSAAVLVSWHPCWFLVG